LNYGLIKTQKERKKMKKINIFLIEDNKKRKESIEYFFNEYSSKIKYGVEVEHIYQGKPHEGLYEYNDKVTNKVESILKKQNETENSENITVFMVDLSLNKKDEEDLKNNIYTFGVAKKIINCVMENEGKVIIETLIDRKIVTDFVKYDINESYRYEKNIHIIGAELFTKQNHKVAIQEINYVFDNIISEE